MRDEFSRYFPLFTIRQPVQSPIVDGLLNILYSSSHVFLQLLYHENQILLRLIPTARIVKDKPTETEYNTTTNTTCMRTRKPMQGLAGVPSKPFNTIWLHWHSLTLASFGCCGVNVTVVIEAYISFPHALCCWNLAAFPRTVSDRKETIWRGTYRRLSPPPRLVQTKPRLHPWTACGQIRSPRIQPGPWSQIARPNPRFPLTMVAADTSKSTFTKVVPVITWSPKKTEDSCTNEHPIF
jgi:hypothetical protein